MHTLKDAPKLGRINLWDATTVGENMVARRHLSPAQLWTGQKWQNSLGKIIVVETAFDKRVNHKGWISNPTPPEV